MKRGTIECPWCDGTGTVPCDAPWCGDCSHSGSCYLCSGSGEVSATWRPDRARWLIRVPVHLVPFRVTLDNPTTFPHRETS